jgi:hypothetical protein
VGRTDGGEWGIVRRYEPRRNPLATGGKYRVTTEYRQIGTPIDPESVRFGYYRNVDAGGEPATTERTRGRTAFVFDAGA